MLTTRLLGTSALAVLCAFGAVACGGSNDSSAEGAVAQSDLSRDTSPNVPAADTATLVDGNTQFAADLYRTAGQAHPSENFFYSPYSVSTALSMVYAGAKNDTASQMASAMHFDLAADKLFPAFDALDLTLNGRSKAKSGGEPGLDLHVVNSLWAEQTFTFHQPYLDTLAVNYGAGVRLKDFAGAPEQARQDINGWVEDQTAKKIVDLLPQGSIDNATRLVLVNAVYFKAAWESPFEATATSPKTFHHLDGSTAQVDEMSKTSYFGYAASDLYEAVELPYAGGDTSMVVVLPREGALAQVEAGLTGDMLTKAFDALHSTEVHLSLPKFTIQGGTISLKDALSSLGMADAFDPSKADLSGIAAEKLWVGDVLHQAFVRVDETGTEAAAATAVPVLGGAAAPTDVVQLDVNRPFLVFIRDLPTKTILFGGRVTDPK